MSFDEAALLLEATPDVLRALLSGLPDQWLAFQEEAGAWSPLTVLVHFVHNERTNWIPRTRIILSRGEERRFSPFQQLPPASEINEHDAGALLDEFSGLRQENLAIRRDLNLTPEDYWRTASTPS